MCGIAGVIGWQTSDTNKIAAMKNIKNTLEKRGPDQHAIYTSPLADLVNTRLHITDIENNRNQHLFQKNDLVLVYDGEIYNKKELKDQLSSLGHYFRYNSDVEVLLTSYIEWGKNCLNRIRGVFSFAIWERENKKLFFARDRIGAKPLFFSITNDVFLFGSEIKSILSHPLSRARVTKDSISEIILLSPNRTPGCGVFSGVEEVKPGHYGIYQNKKLTVKKYWSIDNFTNNDINKKEKLKSLILENIQDSYSSDELLINNLQYQNAEELLQALYTAVDARDLPGIPDLDSELLLFCKNIKSNTAMSGEFEILDNHIRPIGQAYRRSFLRKDIIEVEKDYAKKRYAENNEKLHWNMQPILDRLDRLSMYNGLHLKLPFYDYRIIQHVQKMCNSIEDYNSILSEAIQEVVPNDLFLVPKRKSNITTEKNHSYFKLVSDTLSDTISNPNAPILYFLRKDKILDLILQVIQKELSKNIEKTIQAINFFLQFNYWLDKYL